jgi:hypothetical protein
MGRYGGMGMGRERWKRGRGGEGFMAFALGKDTQRIGKANFDREIARSELVLITGKAE